MSQYQSRERDSKKVAELEWLEEGVDFLVDTAVGCTATIVLRVWQLLWGKNPGQ